MYVERHAVAVTCDGSGAATVYTPVITGEIREIRYVKNNFANGVDFVVTLEATGESLWTENDVNASKSVVPVISTTVGADTVLDRLCAARDRVKIVVTSGGAGTLGTFHVVVG